MGRKVLLVILACSAAFFVAGCAGVGTSETTQEGTEDSAQPGTTQEEAAETSADRPNILFVLTDDLDYASAQKMPEINSLLRDEGVSFENVFTSQSLCCPSRARPS